MLGVLIALLPVVAFLVALLLMDSFKLVPLRAVLVALGAGAVVALACAPLNDLLLERLSLSQAALSRYVAPIVEETAKAVWVVALIRRRRIGFLVDAAILGFAVGTGFALVENVDYLRALSHTRIWLWLVRGFGTALLHGAATAILAVLTQDLAERHPKWGMVTALPGLAAAIGIHSLYNHFVLPPVLATAILVAVLPALLVAVFGHSEKATREWLTGGFDIDIEILNLMLSGQMAATQFGAYLRSLQTRFPGTVVADMLCLLRVQLELSIRAKGMLMAREAGLPLPSGDEVKANLEELRYLERSIGPTGMLALKPLQITSNRDLWQFYLLEEAKGAVRSRA